MIASLRAVIASFVRIVIFTIIFYAILIHRYTVNALFGHARSHQQKSGSGHRTFSGPQRTQQVKFIIMEKYHLPVITEKIKACLPRSSREGKLTFMLMLLAPTHRSLYHKPQGRHNSSPHTNDLLSLPGWIPLADNPSFPTEPFRPRH